jgi:hypothetical protein
MGSTEENCPHPGGLQAVATSGGGRCPTCEAHLDQAGVERWVRAAEEVRDEAYSTVEGDREFVRIALDECQREVYRRRKVLYELRNVPPAVATRPEMILVSYDFVDDSYDCRIFYKEPRPAGGLERISVEADLDPILELRSHSDPNVRLASGKVQEFHVLRRRLAEQDELPMLRRVFYQNEL